MKLQGKVRWICCLLTAIVLLTGVCVAVKPADSYFVCDSGACVENSTIAKPQYFTCTAEICEPTVIQRNQTTELGNNQKQIANRRPSGVLILSSVTVEALERQICHYGVIDDTCCAMACSHVTMVRYIQQQDGKK